jgi:ATP-binding cassette subfamily F protein 3
VLTIQNITLRFGERFLFRDITTTIGSRDRIGLVGPNGAGKSTLLKLILGEIEAEGGIIQKANYVTLGYLPQEGVVAAGRSLYKEAESAFEDIISIQKHIEAASEQLERMDTTSDLYPETLEIIGEWEHRLEELDASRLQSRVETILLGLGFSMSDMERDCNEFSGGWQMRIALAKLLLRQPTLLLLDEPTNHLDLSSLRWLEAFLRKYDGALLLVSHDKAFLNALSNRTLALSVGRMENYAGNYAFFERESVLRRELQAKAFKNQQRELQQTERFIERFRSKASKASQVQSRIKQLDKIERIEIEEDAPDIHFSFPEPRPSGHVVMELENVVKKYGDLTVFEGLNYRIEKGDRIAIVGVNGAGKSTFVRILAGEEPIQNGQIKAGHKVTASYFAQHQPDELDLSKEVLEIMREVSSGAGDTQLRAILGAFLFRGDDAFKRVEVLSGGEKSRLALAKMLLRPANFMIMDEPTNHLDMRSKAVLQKALAEYKGSIVIVSHDRDFLDGIVTKVLEVSQKGVRTFLGNVSDYVLQMEAEAAALEGRRTNAGQKPRAEGESLSPKERRRKEAERRKQIGPLKKRVEELEVRIGELEAQHKEIEASMLLPGFYQQGVETTRLLQEHDRLKTSLEESYVEWEKLTEKLSQ